MKPNWTFAIVGRDLLGFLILAAISLAAGVLINTIRRDPLPLVYLSKAERLNQAVAKMEANPVLGTATSPLNPAPPNIAKGAEALTPVSAPALKRKPAEVREVDIHEFRRLLDGLDCLVVDARPEIFHRLGHVPKALALPRDDFETYYQKHRATLEAYKDRTLLIYCSGSSCEDSHLVANALDRLGYQQLAIFTGGWSQWTAQRLPEER
jgi:rhodanese-related sulfurtransferase